MSQDTSKTIFLSLYPTGAKLLGHTEFLRRVNAGEKATNVNADAIFTRHRETEKLISIISEKMPHLSPDFLQTESWLQVYLVASKRHKETLFLNNLIAEHTPMFHRGGMTFEYIDSFQGTDLFVLKYKSKVA